MKTPLPLQLFPSARDAKKHTRILAQIFGLGEVLPDQSYRSPFHLRCAHGSIKSSLRGYLVRRDRHPNPRQARMINVQIPSAVSREVLRLHERGEDLGVYLDSNAADFAYQTFVFSDPSVRRDRVLLYDHVIDRVVEDQSRRIKLLAQLHDLGYLRRTHLEGSRDAVIYRRVLELERGALIFDRDTPDELHVVPHLASVRAMAGARF
jgi:hypothetical protein